MIDKTFTSELHRALARPDINLLLRATEGYRNWSHRDDDWPDGLDLWFDGGADSDRGLALVVLTMANCDDPEHLRLVAAGLLEDLLTPPPPPSDVFLQRILAEARRTLRFRWMLSGVWRNSMKSDHALAIEKGLGSVDCNRDPLPPRPWA